jgi:anti-sigma factor RsiW
LNCRDVEEFAGAWLDGELDLVRSAEVEAHTRDCAGCADNIRSMESLREAVRAIPYHRAPEQLRERISRTLAPRPQRDWRWISGLIGVPALAAIALMFFLFRPSVPNEIVDAHVRSLLANHLLDVPSTDRHTVKPWFAGKLDYSPDVKTPEGFELMGGRLDYLAGRPVAALVYRRRQHIINVFVWPSGESDRSPALRTDRGFHIAHWTSGGMTWWAVSDLNGEELAELAR